MAPCNALASHPRCVLASQNGRAPEDDAFNHITLKGICLKCFQWICSFSMLILHGCYDIRMADIVKKKKQFFFVVGKALSIFKMLPKTAFVYLVLIHY